MTRGPPTQGGSVVIVLLTLALGLAGCRPSTELSACQEDLDDFSPASKTRVLHLPAQGDVDELTVQILVPIEAGRHDEFTPVAVYVHGSWSSNYVPLEGSTPRLSDTQGLASIYLNLPGGSGEFASPGENDRRGPVARAAIARVLRYAAGDDPDEEGCTLSERTPAGTTGRVAMASFSNGGNLAWTTLADESLDLPDVVGIASFETPASGQLATAEPGTDTRPSPLYEEGACGLDESGGLSCDFDYAPLAWDARLNPATEGVLWVDDADFVYESDEDFPLGVVWNPDSGLWTHSVEAIQAAQASGLELETRSTPTQTEDFWLNRLAPLAMSSATLRFPQISTIETGTEIDHVLQGATDHPHVTGMVAAARRAGVGWTRLHADSTYVELLTDEGRNFADEPANQDVSVGDKGVAMQPEDDESLRGSIYLSAAVLELLDRDAADDWADDLDAPLY